MNHMQTKQHVGCRPAVPEWQPWYTTFKVVSKAMTQNKPSSLTYCIFCKCVFLTDKYSTKCSCWSLKDNIHTPVIVRIDFKIWFLLYTALSAFTPSGIIDFISFNVSNCCLRSSSTGALNVQWQAVVKDAKPGLNISHATESNLSNSLKLNRIHILYQQRSMTLQCPSVLF